MRVDSFLNQICGIKAELRGVFPCPRSNRFIVGKLLARTRAVIRQRIIHIRVAGSDTENCSKGAGIIRAFIFRHEKIIRGGLGKALALKRAENNGIGNHRRGKNVRQFPLINPKTFRQFIGRRLPDDSRISEQPR